ncbi:unnamed protein product [Calicophoron daubneyi]|uniref:Vacuolar fusion protein MON1 homolog n=1 Tax=Calicophoron daubneyi TaxID=300641 RepID=A0AAV2TB77_CALDB
METSDEVGERTDTETDEEIIESDVVLRDPKEAHFLEEHISVRCTDAVKTILEQTRESVPPEPEEHDSDAERASLNTEPSNSESASESEREPVDESVMDVRWRHRDLHVFVLTEAGKPVYSRYGDEGRLSSIIGVMQALVSFVAAAGDELQFINANDRKFVFLCRPHLILVAVGLKCESTEQLVLCLGYVYSQILSLLSLKRMEQSFNKKQNLDLRRLLIGDRQLISSVIDFAESSFGSFLQANSCVPLSPSTREGVSQIIIQAIKSRQDLVFAILLSQSHVITIVRMKGYSLHPSDIHLIINLVCSSQSLKSVQTHWLPICLPKFDANGFLYAHISYMENDICLVLLSVDSTQFYTLQEAKNTIFERLRSVNDGEYLSAISAANFPSLLEIGIPELRHFVYKYIPTAQYVSSQWDLPYAAPVVDDSDLCSKDLSPSSHKVIPIGSLVSNVMLTYRRMHARLHSESHATRMIYQATPNEVFFASISDQFELYATFEPLVSKTAMAEIRKNLVKWITSNKHQLFALSSPTF